MNLNHNLFAGSGRNNMGVVTIYVNPNQTQEIAQEHLSFLLRKLTWIFASNMKMWSNLTKNVLLVST